MSQYSKREAVMARPEAEVAPSGGVVQGVETCCRACLELHNGLDKLEERLDQILQRVPEREEREDRVPTDTQATLLRTTERLSEEIVRAEGRVVGLIERLAL